MRFGACYWRYRSKLDREVLSGTLRVLTQRKINGLLAGMAISDPRPHTHYGDYLQLDKLLDAQHPKSGADGPAAHDEMLFIVIHQSYELWFKLILHELNSVASYFEDDGLDPIQMGVIVARCQRVVEIQRILVNQLSVLETMTPLDFLDFRDYLVPASGFQSVQFRLIETTLGLRSLDRATTDDGAAFQSGLKDDEKRRLAAHESTPSLFTSVERWLERIPFLDRKGYDFWKEYAATVAKKLDDEDQQIRQQTTPGSAEREVRLGQLEQTRNVYGGLIDKDKYKKLQQQGVRRLSHRAMSAALFIELYREYPALQLPHRLLSLLVDIDELFTAWRQRHAIMVHRMIGRKVGTGGSSGTNYLQAASEKHKVFTDLFDLPTYLFRRSGLPSLPAELEEFLGFRYEK